MALFNSYFLYWSKEFILLYMLLSIDFSNYASI